MQLYLKLTLPILLFRFHQVVWGPGASGGGDSGIIVGGCDGGMLQIYSPSKMLAGQEPLVARKEGHNGPVKTLDLNPFQVIFVMK